MRGRGMKQRLAALGLALGLLGAFAQVASAEGGATVKNYGNCVINGFVDPSQDELGHPGFGPGTVVTNAQGQKLVGPLESPGKVVFTGGGGCNP